MASLSVSEGDILIRKEFKVAFRFFINMLLCSSVILMVDLSTMPHKYENWFYITLIVISCLEYLFLIISIIWVIKSYLDNAIKFKTGDKISLV